MSSYHFTSTGFSQRDSAWGPARLGTSPSHTLASAGCLVTAAAEMMYRWNIKTDPGKLNRWLSKNGGYAGTHLFVFNSLENWPDFTLPAIKLDELIDCRKVPAPVGSIQCSLDFSFTHDQPSLGLLIQVAFNPYQRGSQHWVMGYMNTRINGEDDIQVMDPWTGKMISLLSGPYGRPDWDLERMIMRVAVYKLVE